MSRMGMARARGVGACAAILLSSVTAFAAAPVVVNQVRRAFSVRELHVARGDRVQFNNVDEFLHQLFIDSPQFKYSSNEQPPGQAIDIAFPTKGTFEVRCEIHPKMMMSVVVE